MSKKSKINKSNRFIEIFKQILDRTEYIDIIKWDEQGIKIQIIDKSLLQENVLPRFFKHSNYSSFLRQLNIYGFISCRDQNGILTYQHPYFTQSNMIQKLIQKKKQIIVDKQQIGTFIIEQEELKSTMTSLKQEQLNIQQQLVKSIQQQLRFQHHFKLIIEKLLEIKAIQERRGVFFIESIRMIVRAMKPEAQTSFQYLIKCVYPNEEDLWMSETLSIKEDEIEIPYPTSPATFGKAVVEDIGNYLNHKQEQFNLETLEPVWFFGQQEADFSFFGFDL
ncbi:unnamed protein product [Paramecium sonneborni]|uniref:HSF-type DNA-binding domain-containing protein n=1 Tax=Paramecium sonneborni TaxID=65129 RepID=A0A8S1N004_9CILI|nr:unnamed protein product [Paramecium sonneborni]